MHKSILGKRATTLIGLLMGVWLLNSQLLAQAPVAAGSLEQIKVTGVSLQGNLEGDSAERDANDHQHYQQLKQREAAR